MRGEARATELGLLRLEDGRVRLGPDRLDLVLPFESNCSDTFRRLFAELNPDSLSPVWPFITLLLVTGVTSCRGRWGGLGLSGGESYSDNPAYWLIEFAYGARTIVCRLDGAVEVSDSEMLSKVPSLRKLDFLSREEF